MRTKLFTYYTDPAHGWVKVPKKLITELNISDKISGCSFIRNNHVYLEEDMDFATFNNAMTQHNMFFTLKVKHTNRSSKLRSYDSYSPTKLKK